MVDAIDNSAEIDFEFITLPQVTHQKYQTGLKEDELMVEIGRTATKLFSLLHQAQPKTPSLAGLVVIREKTEPRLQQEDEQVEDVASDRMNDSLEDAIEHEAEASSAGESTEQKKTKEMIEREIENYRNQVRTLSQIVTEEKQVLKTQEQIQLLQQLNRAVNSPLADTKKERMTKIEQHENAIKAAQNKIAELTVALQDI